jgi:hypothetical protein
MSDTGVAVKPLDEIGARRAVAGLDVDMIEQAGVSPAEADAVAAALRQFLIGDIYEARKGLEKVFRNGTVDQILAEFGKIPDAA